MNEHESPMMKCDEPGGMVIVKFRWEGARNEAASESQGRPIYDNVLKVDITSPGSKNQVATHEVERRFWAPEGEKPRVRENTQLKGRFREQLAAWEKNSAEELSGTPLRELPGLDRGQIETCRELGIHTIEALAGISDGNLFMGARRWREMAQAYLEKAAGNAPLSKLTAQNEAQAKRIEELEATVKALAAKEDEPKRGRPKKEAA